MQRNLQRNLRNQRAGECIFRAPQHTNFENFPLSANHGAFMVSMYVLVCPPKNSRYVTVGQFKLLNLVLKTFLKLDGSFIKNNPFLSFIKKIYVKRNSLVKNCLDSMQYISTKLWQMIKSTCENVEFQWITNSSFSIQTLCFQFFENLFFQAFNIKWSFKASISSHRNSLTVQFSEATSRSNWQIGKYRNVLWLFCENLPSTR